MRSLIPAFLALSLFSAQSQAAVDCITKQQVADVTLSIVPPIISKARDRCAAHLPESAFLRQQASLQFAERLNIAGQSRVSSAAQAIRAFSKRDAPEGLDDKALVGFMAELFPAGALASVDAEGCANLDTLFETMSAMTPDQLGRFIAAFFALAKVKSPTICKS